MNISSGFRPIYVSDVLAVMRPCQNSISRGETAYSCQLGCPGHRPPASLASRGECLLQTAQRHSRRAGPEGRVGPRKFCSLSGSEVRGKCQSSASMFLRTSILEDCCPSGLAVATLQACGCCTPAATASSSQMGNIVTGSADADASEKSGRFSGKSGSPLESQARIHSCTHLLVDACRRFRGFGGRPRFRVQDEVIRPGNCLSSSSRRSQFLCRLPCASCLVIPASRRIRQGGVRADFVTKRSELLHPAPGSAAMLLPSRGTWVVSADVTA